MVFYKARCLGLLTGLVFLLPFQPVFAQATSPPVDLWDDLDLLYQRANLAAEAEDYQQAVETYREIIRRDPNSPSLWSTYRNLGYYLMQLKQYEDAAEVYRTAIKLNPNYATLYLQLGLCLNYQALLVMAEKDIYSDPNSVLGWAAADEVKKAISLDPENAHYHYVMGSIYQKLGRYQEAEAAYKNSARLDPAWTAAAYSEIAESYNFQRQYAIAETFARQAIEADREYVPAYVQLGLVLRNQGKLPEALECLREGLELVKKNPDAEHSVTPAFFEPLICRLAEPAGTPCD